MPVKEHISKLGASIKQLVHRLDQYEEETRNANKVPQVYVNKYGDVEIHCQQGTSVTAHCLVHGGTYKFVETFIIGSAENVENFTLLNELTERITQLEKGR